MREFATYTAFFRHSLPHETIGRFVEWRSIEKEDLKIHVAACSQGMEVLSLAIVLAEAGLKDYVTILGSDISTELISKAKTYKYSAKELSSLPHIYRGRYFEQLESGEFEFKQHLCPVVEYEVYDLLTPPRHQHKADIVLANNLWPKISKLVSEDELDRILANLMSALADKDCLLSVFGEKPAKVADFLMRHELVPMYDGMVEAITEDELARKSWSLSDIHNIFTTDDWSRKYGVFFTSEKMRAQISEDLNGRRLRASLLAYNDSFFDALTNVVSEYSLENDQDKSVEQAVCVAVCDIRPSLGGFRAIKSISEGLDAQVSVKKIYHVRQGEVNEEDEFCFPSSVFRALDHADKLKFFDQSRYAEGVLFSKSVEDAWILSVPGRKNPEWLIPQSVHCQLSARTQSLFKYQAHLNGHLYFTPLTYGHVGHLLSKGIAKSLDGLYLPSLRCDDLAVAGEEKPVKKTDIVDGGQVSRSRKSYLPPAKPADAEPQMARSSARALMLPKPAQLAPDNSSKNNLAGENDQKLEDKVLPGGPIKLDRRYRAGPEFLSQLPVAAHSTLEITEAEEIEETASWRFWDYNDEDSSASGDAGRCVYTNEQVYAPYGDYQCLPGHIKGRMFSPSSKQGLVRLTGRREGEGLKLPVAEELLPALANMDQSIVSNQENAHKEVIVPDIDILVFPESLLSVSAEEQEDFLASWCARLKAGGFVAVLSQHRAKVAHILRKQGLLAVSRENERVYKGNRILSWRARSGLDPIFARLDYPSDVSKQIDSHWLFTKPGEVQKIKHCGRLEPMLVDARGICLRFPRHYRKSKGGVRTQKYLDALDHVDLKVYHGETLGVIGGNGAGKSTLLRLLAGVFRPDKGELNLYGKSRLAALGLGLNLELSGRANIDLMCTFLGLNRAERKEAILDVISFSDLGEFIDMPVRYYSSGMRARLSFAITTVEVPDLLLLDEVFATGDGAFAKKSKARLANVLESAGAVIIVSHQLGILRSLANRVLWLDKGRVRDVGDPERVLKAYTDEYSG